MRTSSSCSHSSASDPALGQVRFDGSCCLLLDLFHNHIFPPCGPCGPCCTCPTTSHHIPALTAFWLHLHAFVCIPLKQSWSTSYYIFFFFYTPMLSASFYILPLCVQTLQLVWMGLSPLLMQSHTGRALNSESAVSHLTLHFVISLNSCQPFAVKSSKCQIMAI